MSTRREFLMGTAAASLAAGPYVHVAKADSQKATDAARSMKTYTIPHSDLVVSRIAYGKRDAGSRRDRAAISYRARFE